MSCRRHCYRLAAIALAAGCLPIPAQAQAPAAPAFEVAIIKRNDPERNRGVLAGVSHPSPVRHQYVGSLKFLIRQAYNVNDEQISGGPGWVDRDLFEIDAKTAAPASQEQLNAMLQTLLAERFHLALHHATKQMPIYAMVQAKGRTKLQATEGTGTSAGRGFVRGTMEMDTLARNLTAVLGRPVIDQTGLRGTYKVALQWSPDDQSDASGPSPFTAIQEQLGLRLDAQKGPVPILTIDRAEKPSEN